MFPVRCHLVFLTSKLLTISALAVAAISAKSEKASVVFASIQNNWKCQKRQQQMCWFFVSVGICNLVLSVVLKCSAVNLLSYEMWWQLRSWHTFASSMCYTEGHDFVQERKCLT